VGLQFASGSHRGPLAQSSKAVSGMAVERRADEDHLRASRYPQIDGDVPIALGRCPFDGIAGEGGIQ